MLFRERKRGSIGDGGGYPSYFPSMHYINYKNTTKKKSKAVTNSNTYSKRERKAVTKPGTKNTMQSPH